MTPLRTAVVGLGIGRQHLDAMAALPAQYQVVALCDTDPDRLQAQATLRGVTRCHSRYEALLADPEIELVSLCTPPHLHRTQILQALAAGKHVVCEKPLVVSLAEWDEVSAAARGARGRVFPMFQVRWGLGLQQLRALQAAGLTGQAQVATVETHWHRGAEYYAAAPWRGQWATEHGGVCLTQAIHAHDLLTEVLGPVASVSALLATRANPVEVEDCAAITLRLRSGALASLSATLGAAHNHSRLRFVFSELTAVSASANPYRPAEGPWAFSARTPQAQAAVDAVLAGLVPRAQGFVGQFNNIHHALRQGVPARVGLDDARRALALVTAIYQSADEGRRVDLPIAPDHRMYRDWRPAAAAVPHQPASD